MKYVCKYCGTEADSISSLTRWRGDCSYSPTGKHQPFEGSTDGGVVCKYCGTKADSISSLTCWRGDCSNSPTGKHQPYEGK